MRISLNWLKEYIDLPKDLTPEELALKLTMATVEIEEIIDLGAQLNDVYVGRINKIVKHPDADKLSVAEVDLKHKKIKVIFGQMAVVHEGDLVPVAMAPTTLPTGITIEAKEIRGVKSEGMLCLNSELSKEGLAELTYFPAGTKVGALVKDLMGLNDIVFEVDNKSITHRPDLWGHYGLAREVAAIYGLKLQDLKIEEFKEGSEVDLKIEIKDPENCSRYLGLAISGIKIEPAPAWLQRLLNAVGVRAINNIVDITNFVMLELGRPSHAFDRRDVAGDAIIVRRARKGERFTTLDGQARILTDQMCLVCDANKPVDLGGIMGGQNSEIKNDTTEVILELANFNPVNIRKTAQALNLRTEAATRFEKGMDSSLAELGLKRIVTLIQQLIPGSRVVSKIVDINPAKQEERLLELNLDFLNKRIGQAIPKKEVIGILERLSFTVKDRGETLLVAPPSFRVAKDISIPEDLVEEVARIYGYDKIAPQMPAMALASPEDNLNLAVADKARDILAAVSSATEVYNYSFVGSTFLTLLGLKAEDHYQISNYLSEDQRYLRISLFEQLFKNLQSNLRFYQNINIFELGRIYTKAEGEYPADNSQKSFLAKQEQILAGLLTDASLGGRIFFKVKGQMEILLEGLEVDYNYQQPSQAGAVPGWLNSDRYLELRAGGQLLGWLAEVKENLSQKLGANSRVGVWQLNFELLAKLAQDKKKYRPAPKYPGMIYDFSLVVADNIAWAKIRQEVQEVSQLIKRVELFDVFQLAKLGPDKKSLAFHVYFLAEDKTLTSPEADQLKAKITDLLKKKFKAEIR